MCEALMQLRFKSWQEKENVYSLFDNVSLLFLPEIMENMDII